MDSPITVFDSASTWPGRPCSPSGSSLKALVTVSIWMWAAFAANAQQGADALWLRVEPAMDHMTTKRVYELVRGFDPDGRVDIATDHIELRLAAHVPVDELINALNALGTSRFGKFDGGIASEREVPAVLPADFPRFIATGDPEADEAAHAAAKQQWLLAHPEFYNRKLKQSVR